MRRMSPQARAQLLREFVRDLPAHALAFSDRLESSVTRIQRVRREARLVEPEHGIDERWRYERRGYTQGGLGRQQRQLVTDDDA
jgi:hypothetical protein